MVRFILRLAAKILSVGLFLLTLAAAWGGHISPHIWATPSILALILPYLGMATAAVTVCWGIARKIVMTALGVLTLVASIGSLSEAVPFGSENKPEGGVQFTLLTYNMMHGIDYSDPTSGAGTTLRYILHSGADIAVLQEMSGLSTSELPNTPPDLIDSLKATYPYRLIDRANYLSVLSRFPIGYSRATNPKTSYDCIYTVDIQGHRLTLVNTHLESYRFSDNERDVVSDIHSVGSAKSSLKRFKGSILSKMKQSFRIRADESQQLRRQLDSLPDPVIVCGDFNDVPTSWAYRKIKDDDFRDAFSETNFGHRITYHAHRMYFHIDQMLYRGDIRPISVKRIREGASDHWPLLAEFEFTGKRL